MASARRVLTFAASADRATGQALPQSGQGARGAQCHPGAGETPTSGLLCLRPLISWPPANGLVVIEDLKINTDDPLGERNSPRSPERNVKAKTGAQPCHPLQRVAVSSHWRCPSAARYTGTRVVTVPPHRTSQRCSACGHVDPKSRESQAVFRCAHCSHAEHADVNAAKCILAAGLAVTACEDSPQPSGLVVSPKQEPAGNREELLLQPHTAA